MKDTLQYIVDKFDIDLDQRNPIEIPNFGRDNLPELFKELGFQVGVEVGTEKGKYAEILCKGIPDLKLYCVDYWNPYPGYRENISKEKYQKFYEITQDRLKNYDVELVRKFSMDAVRDFEDKSLDFVYIDGSHEFQQVVNDISEWIKKIRPGGIISGHDYRRAKKAKYQRHVVSAVKGYTRAYFINPWFVLGRRARLEGEIRDRHRSWMWVVE